MTVSIIIPLYNEEKNVAQLWEDLMALEAAQILFVDGGSRDKTVAILEEKLDRYRKRSESAAELYPNAKHDIRLLHSPKKGRANQMNFGAGYARGDILFFVHADSRLPKTAVSDIRTALRSKAAGCFKLRFSPNSFLMTCCGFLSGFRVKSRKIMFGDQGIFVRRSLFEKTGGFADLPIMEDYEFSIRLKKMNLIPAMTKSAITTSSRRFTQNGTIRTMIQMQKLQYRFRKGKDIEAIRRAYRDIR